MNPGGFTNWRDDESFLDAARRETLEEIAKAFPLYRHDLSEDRAFDLTSTRHSRRKGAPQSITYRMYISPCVRAVESDVINERIREVLQQRHFGHGQGEISDAKWVHVDDLLTLAKSASAVGTVRTLRPNHQTEEKKIILEFSLL